MGTLKEGTFQLHIHHLWGGICTCHKRYREHWESSRCLSSLHFYLFIKRKRDDDCFLFFRDNTLFYCLIGTATEMRVKSCETGTHNYIGSTASQTLLTFAAVPMSTRPNVWEHDSLYRIIQRGDATPAYTSLRDSFPLLQSGADCTKAQSAPERELFF